MILMLLILVIQLKKTDYKSKVNEIEKKITDRNPNKYITTQAFIKLTAENFTARLKQANLARKNDIADFVKKMDFDDKLKNLNKKYTSNKTKHVLVENELNEISKKDLINKYSILKYSSGILQFSLVFISANKYFTFFSGTTDCGSLMECQKKVCEI